MKLSWKYPKIMSIYKRHPGTKEFIIGEYSTPEIKYLKDNKWVFTEKVDGTNIRIKWDGKEAIYAGRSDNAQLYVSLIHKLDELFKTSEARQELEKTFEPEEGMEICLYGEGFGTRVQKGGGNYIPDGVNFVLFDVCINRIWLERHNVDDIASKLNICLIPIIGEGILDDAIEMAKKGFKSWWGDFMAEGIVARPETELFTRRGDRIITKVKYKDFN